MFYSLRAAPLNLHLMEDHWGCTQAKCSTDIIELKQIHIEMTPFVETVVDIIFADFYAECRSMFLDRMIISFYQLNMVQVVLINAAFYFRILFKESKSVHTRVTSNL